MVGLNGKLYISKKNVPYVSAFWMKKCEIFLQWAEKHFTS